MRCFCTWLCILSCILSNILINQIIFSSLSKKKRLNAKLSAQMPFHQSKAFHNQQALCPALSVWPAPLFAHSQFAAKSECKLLAKRKRFGCHAIVPFALEKLTRGGVNIYVLVYWRSPCKPMPQSRQYGILHFLFKFLAKDHKNVILLSIPTKEIITFVTHSRKQSNVFDVECML